MRTLAATLLLVLALTPLSVFAADAPGVPNFHSVTDHLYRGGQPTREGIGSLVKIGIRTVVDLRTGKDREEEKLVKAAGMRYVHVPMGALSAPSDQQIASALETLDDVSAAPVFIHCKRGADRTGTVIACYRIRHDQWENQKALSEARKNGLSWVERGMQQYILQFETKLKLADSKATVQAAPVTP
jgi:tyrosine-protein phosphatase SIW14